MVRKLSNIKDLQYSDFPLLILPQEPHKDTDLHTHSFTELVVVYDGDGVHFTENHSHKVKAGDVFVIQGDQAHGYKHCRDLYLFNILFKPEKLGCPLMDLQLVPAYHAMFVLEPHFRMEKRLKSHLKINQHQLETVLVIIKQMQQELDDMGPGYKRMALSYLIQLIVYLSRCYANYSSPDSVSFIRLGEVITYLESHLNQQISLDKLADIAHMSVSSLTRRFKRVTQHTPIEYFIRLKVNKACELLKCQDLTISEIADRVGFTDSNYFTRQFRRIKGVSPREYSRFING